MDEDGEFNEVRRLQEAQPSPERESGRDIAALTTSIEASWSGIALAATPVMLREPDEGIAGEKRRSC